MTEDVNYFVDRLVEIRENAVWGADVGAAIHQVFGRASAVLTEDEYNDLGERVIEMWEEALLELEREREN